MLIPTALLQDSAFWTDGGMSSCRAITNEEIAEAQLQTMRAMQQAKPLPAWCYQSLAQYHPPVPAWYRDWSSQMAAEPVGNP